MIMICQCGFIHCNKCVLQGVLKMGEAKHICGQGIYGNFCTLSFAVKVKLL